MLKPVNLNDPREVEAAAHRYALANRSDPFAYRRALTHIRVGIVGMRREKPFEPAIYDARAVPTEREYYIGRERRTFIRLEYQDMVRP